VTDSPAFQTAAPRVDAEPFGRLGDAPVTRYVLRNGPLEVAVLDLGGTVQSVLAPDRDGVRREITLGFDSVEQYRAHDAYFGALIGRSTNRIAGGRFTLEGREYELAVNNGENNLHGGPEGFDARLWAAEVLDPSGGQPDGTVGLRLTLHSPDGDQGFPGALDVAATYLLDAAGRLRLDLEATNVEPDGGLATVVNLTNHAYWNLAGEGSGSVEDHLLRLHASRYTPLAPSAVPTGELAPVEGTAFDFRRPTRIGDRLRDPALAATGGYDHNYVLDGAGGGAPVGEDGLALAAVAHDPATGRVLRIRTDQPGIQFYSGNFLLGTLVGRGGAYRMGDAFCLETQHFPDSPNRPEFPSTVLEPGRTFRTSTVYEFDVAPEA